MWRSHASLDEAVIIGVANIICLKQTSLKKRQALLVAFSGAGDRGRTCMLLALDPKSSASANSATPAYITVALSSNGGIIAQIISFVNT